MFINCESDSVDQNWQFKATSLRMVPIFPQILTCFLIDCYLSLMRNLQRRKFWNGHNSLLNPANLARIPIWSKHQTIQTKLDHSIVVTQLFLETNNYLKFLFENPSESTHLKNASPSLPTFKTILRCWIISPGIWTSKT